MYLYTVKRIECADMRRFTVFLLIAASATAFVTGYGAALGNAMTISELRSTVHRQETEINQMHNELSTCNNEQTTVRTQLSDCTASLQSKPPDKCALLLCPLLDTKNADWAAAVRGLCSE